MFDVAASRLLQTMANRHVIKLSAMSPAEAHRLQTFLQIAALSMYSELADLGEKLFITAQLSCLREIESVITRLKKAS